MARADAPTRSEIVVLNTCTVTASADQDARAAIRRIRRDNPDCQIVVTGCYAQRSPEEVASLPGVSRVIGNSHKHQLAEIVVASRSGDQVSSAAEPTAFVPLSSLGQAWQNQIFVSDIFAHTELLGAPVFDAAGPGLNDRTRPNLKVQDGCDNRCSFCVIPYVRGLSRSLPLNRILNEVNSLVHSGYREVVISGINLGRWGRDFDEPLRFENVVHEILDQTVLEKLRISSVEPMDWSDELIGMMASSPRIAKHAHVPMQSGSDRVLRAMHRKYRPWHYREKLEKIRAAMPTAAIGADVMVGFPGESEADFEQTRRLIEELPFTYLHVFHLFLASGNAGSGHARSGSGASRTRTQPDSARPSRGEKTGLHADFYWKDGGSDHFECVRWQVDRSTDRQLSETAATGTARNESVGKCAGRASRSWRFIGGKSAQHDFPLVLRRQSPVSGKSRFGYAARISWTRLRSTDELLILYRLCGSGKDYEGR